RKARRWCDLPYEDVRAYQSFESQSTFKFENVPNNVSIILEGTQGYGLGLHAGMYPYCTSSNTRSIDFLAMAAIYPERWIELGAYIPVVVCRTY
ncbi:adenylosuccinate synthetase, partial [Staphylococcus aureus]|uniref:adenylosuccinate synthetase n=1 Tax=Staphylococcus aureus TaxID=1280 RepID=UPI0034D96F88